MEARMSDLPELKYLDIAAKAAGFEFGWETGFHLNSPIGLSFIAHARALQKLAELEAENAWRPIGELPNAEKMAVLLYYPSERHEDFDGVDYSISIGGWDRSRLDYGSGWFEQGTNHDCFEPHREEYGTTPTHFRPLPSPPKGPDA
jgi:hypothetical protein